MRPSMPIRFLQFTNGLLSQCAIQKKPFFRLSYDKHLTAHYVIIYHTLPLDKSMQLFEFKNEIGTWHAQHPSVTRPALSLHTIWPVQDDGQDIRYNHKEDNPPSHEASSYCHTSRLYVTRADSHTNSFHHITRICLSQNNLVWSRFKCRWITVGKRERMDGWRMDEVVSGLWMWQGQRSRHYEPNSKSGWSAA